MPASSLGLNSTILQKAEEDSPAVFPLAGIAQRQGKDPPLGLSLPEHQAGGSHKLFCPDDGHVSSRAAAPWEGPKICCGFFFKNMLFILMK